MPADMLARGAVRKSPYARPSASEHQIQAALFKWAALARVQWPELTVMYAIPNAGKRSAGAAAYMRAEGMRAGVPDVCLPVSRHGCSALYIEHKAGRNDSTPAQQAWQRALRDFGARVIVSRSFDESRNAIRLYLSP